MNLSLLNSRTLEIIEKHLEALNGLVEEYSGNMDHSEIRILYRDEFDNLHRLVIKSTF